MAEGWIHLDSGVSDDLHRPATSLAPGLEKIPNGVISGTPFELQRFRDPLCVSERGRRVVIFVRHTRYYITSIYSIYVFEIRYPALRRKWCSVAESLPQPLDE
jgi:hypothetical protein